MATGGIVMPPVRWMGTEPMPTLPLMKCRGRVACHAARCPAKRCPALQRINLYCHGIWLEPHLSLPRIFQTAAFRCRRIPAT